MLTTTTDPMTGRDVKDIDHAPFVIEGRGEHALKIYFETEATRRAYLDVALEFDAIDNTVAQAHGGTTHIAREM